MSAQPTSHFRRLRRWLLPAALLVLAPKCILCLATYVGVAAALGWGGPEFCGTTSDPLTPWEWFGLGSLAFVFLGLYAWRRAGTKTPKPGR